MRNAQHARRSRRSTDVIAGSNPATHPSSAVQAVPVLRQLDWSDNLSPGRSSCSLKVGAFSVVLIRCARRAALSPATRSMPPPAAACIMQPAARGQSTLSPGCPQRTTGASLLNILLFKPDSTPALHAGAPDAFRPAGRRQGSPGPSNYDSLHHRRRRSFSPVNEVCVQLSGRLKSTLWLLRLK